MRKLARNHSAEAMHNARRLRREMTASEKVLWECVRKERLGFAFKRQVPVGPYTLDFYCPEASLCVEVDGERHDAQRDEARDLFLEGKNILTVRVRSLDLFDANSLAAEQALSHIRRTCEGRTGRKAS
jgi:very-short-patch-repair endonuclease